MRRPKVLEDAQFYMKKPVDSILTMLELYPEYFQIDPNKEKPGDKQGEGTFVGLLEYPDDAAGLSRVPTVRDAEPAESGMIASSSVDPVMAGAAAHRTRRAAGLRVPEEQVFGVDEASLKKQLAQERRRTREALQRVKAS